jgi:LuxR family maltose regulon positive regulatory protein
MFAPLLATKLYIPSPRLVQRLVPRLRLTRRLDEGLHLGHTLTLVSAPAGFGKTTLVSEWVHRVKLPVAWLSLDEGDNDTTRFLAYIVAALQTVETGLGETVAAMLESPQMAATPFLIEHLITLLINDLAALPTQILLILDDYHVINNLDIHTALAFLLENLPPQVHLVVVSREDPVLPLHRLRAGGRMTEMRAQDLRFTEEEAALFLNQAMELDLEADDVASLEKQTEGWIAGLQLAALSIRDSADAKSFIQTFAGDDRYVMDYLVAEVLARQPPHIQTFLLKTSILDRLTPALCDAVTGQTNSRAILAHLEQTNLFLVPLDNRREWYRYHHLFGDLLRYRLREQLGDEVDEKHPEVKQLHQQAAAWHIEADLIEPAIQHSLAGGDFAQAADLLESISGGLVARCQLHKLLNLVESLPDDLVRTHPYLCLHHAWALRFTRQAEASATRLEDAERALFSLPPAQARYVQGQIYTLRGGPAFSRQGPAAAIECYQKALHALAAADPEARCIAQYELGDVYLFLGEWVKAREAFQATQTPGLENLWIVVGGKGGLADTYAIEGRLGQAMQLYREAIAQGLGPSGERLFPPTDRAYAGLGDVLYERGEIDEARRCFEQAIRLSEMIDQIGTALMAIVSLAWLEHTQGNHQAAQVWLQRARERAQQRTDWFTDIGEAYLARFQVRLALLQEPPDLATAARWSRAYRRDQSNASRHEEELAQRLLARVELAQGQPEQALARLGRLEDAATVSGRGNSLLSILVLQAVAHAAQGASAQAIQTLERALDLGAAEGYCRTFLDQGPVVIQLLRQSHHPYAAQLLGSVPVEIQKRPALEQALSEREIEALRLLAAGLTYAEIARELFVSINTVKWHAKNIYRKLDVNRRAYAVAKARDLGLIP